ncbi:unnamed protein product [Ambrosiozyma monospora]|uniref:Unnamed protein product n=2 Tax=Ambrosiozyma monospora TaxID=43982 RepID=A0ACB5TM55_AMBMO|nr:unnamed protein product [Ambrosiozyma monospora]GMG39870.1 unnamed protein product [Ambrosiozyma monospora]
MPLQQVSRVGGPNKCFGQFQKAIECMTNANVKNNDECNNFKNDFIECRRHRLETYKMVIMQQHLEKDRKDLNVEELGAPYVKKRDYLTPKTLGLVNGDDHAIASKKF